MKEFFLSMNRRNFVTEMKKGHHPYWSKISEEAKSFIRLGLTQDANERPFADEMLDHPWLKKFKVPSGKMRP